MTEPVFFDSECMKCGNPLNKHSEILSMFLHESLSIQLCLRKGFLIFFCECVCLDTIDISTFLDFYDFSKCLRSHQNSSFNILKFFNIVKFIDSKVSNEWSNRDCFYKDTKYHGTEGEREEKISNRNSGKLPFWQDNSCRNEEHHHHRQSST